MGGLILCGAYAERTGEGGGGVLTIHVYMVKRGSYIYSAKNFSPYPMWDMTIILSCRHNIFVVSHGIAEPNKLLHWIKDRL